MNFLFHCFKLGIIDWNPDSKESANNIRDVQRSQQKMQLSKLRAQSFHHGKREDLTSFGTLKIDIFKVLGYGDSKKKYCRFGRVSERPC